MMNCQASRSIAKVSKIQLLWKKKCQNKKEEEQIKEIQLEREPIIYDFIIN